MRSRSSVSNLKTEFTRRPTFTKYTSCHQSLISIEFCVHAAVTPKLEKNPSPKLNAKYNRKPIDAYKQADKRKRHQIVVEKLEGDCSSLAPLVGQLPVYGYEDTD